MARSFNGTSDYLEYAGGAITALPITLAIWANKDDTTALDVAISISDKDATNRIGIAFTAAAKVRIVGINTAGSNGNADTTASYSASTWHHAAAVFSSATSRTIYLDGGNAVTDTNSIDVSPANFDSTTIGSFIISTGRSQYFGGKLAEAGIWSVALTAAEIASLAKGMSPLQIRPESLVAYYPLIGNASPEVDLRGRYEMTVTGAVKADHPAIYNPRNTLFVRKNTYKVPVFYRQRQMQGMAS